MDTHRGKKINQLRTILPSGILVNKRWFQEQGYDPVQITKYVQSGWLESPARGVFRLPGFSNRKLEAWEPIVISLQAFVDEPFIVGGRTALELQGFAHYVSSAGPGHIHLYGQGPLPGWVSKMNVGVKFSVHKQSLFSTEMKSGNLVNAPYGTQSGLRRAYDPLHNGFRETTWGADELPLVMSSPERAILELLNEVPGNESFDMADKMFEGLRTLDPRRLNRLLHACKRVKVKRLFMWFAERHDFRWRRKLEEIDLGAGKRSLVPDGAFDPTYLITVPRNMTRDDI